MEKIKSGPCGPSGSEFNGICVWIVGFYCVDKWADVGWNFEGWNGNWFYLSFDWFFPRAGKVAFLVVRSYATHRTGGKDHTNAKENKSFLCVTFRRINNSMWEKCFIWYGSPSDTIFDGDVAHRGRCIWRVWASF